MDSISYLFRITPKSRQLVAQAGNWGLYETVFAIERASTKDDNLVRMRPGLPAPSTRDIYLDIPEAHRRTGISKKELRRLCKEGRIAARLAGKNWLILLESLERYVEANNN